MAAEAPRRTKIVATLGPASAGRIEELVAAGMDAARLNLSHGTHAEHAEMAASARSIESERGRPLAVIADLQGPKLRIGDLPAPVVLSRGDEIVVGPKGIRSTCRSLPRSWADCSRRATTSSSTMATYVFAWSA